MLGVTSISSWHAHVYFGAESRDAAMAFRGVIAAQSGNPRDSAIWIGRSYALDRRAVGG